MTQVSKIYQYEDISNKSGEQNKFETVEKIVSELVEKGIPKNLTFSDYVVRVANFYNINVSEAKTCIKLAMSEMDTGNIQQEETPELNGQCGYYYPSGYNTLSNPKAKQDGMDSLSFLGSYNKLMFLR